MTLEDLGNIGEFVGSIGVIATLIYLAVQIRQNTKSLRSTVEQTISETLAHGYQSIAATCLPHIYVRASSDPSSLTDEELAQFGFFVSGYLKHMEQAYYQYSQGNLSEPSWKALDVSFVTQFSSSLGMQRFWDLRSHTYRIEFQDYVASVERNEETKEVRAV